jgi:hypothetical protein
MVFGNFFSSLTGNWGIISDPVKYPSYREDKAGGRRQEAVPMQQVAPSGMKI